MLQTENQKVKAHIAKYLKYGQFGNELWSVNRINHERYLCQKITKCGGKLVPDHFLKNQN